ncbi:MAG: single-stranded-DNA-specific exonuclease RecJ [Chitinophagaceae bacterium]
MDKRWNFTSFQTADGISLQQSLKIHPVLCQLLNQRGIKTFQEAESFFRPSLKDLHDPWLMKDMKKAVDRVEAAILKNEKILIYGDYDVDGTTAVAVVFSFLRTFHENMDFYIPHRYREGYGISLEGIEFARENGFTLIIALDCGIKSADHISHASSLGIDFIICDHHQPDSKIPQATAILNPKQPDCAYPFKELSGCGIGFKFINALADRRNTPREKTQEWLDLVATSIAADMVLMTGENRILAFWGLHQVNERPSTGIRAILDLNEIKTPLHIQDLIFIVAPRVNAAGRMDDAKKAVQLFLETDLNKALGIAQMLQSDNLDRKEIDKTITREAIEMVQENVDFSQGKTTFLFQPHWHQGVVGIVASRLVEKFYRPTIVLTGSFEKITGSARSVSGFNIYEAIHACGELLDNYGGHFYAAGLSLKKENLPLFHQKFEEVVAQSIDPQLLIPELLIDAELSFTDIGFSFFNILQQFGPFGPENPKPIFISRRVRDNGLSRIVKNDHIRFDVKQSQGPSFKGIGFYLAEKFYLLEKGEFFDMVFMLEENKWNGMVSLQLKVLDIRPVEN